MGSAPYAFSVHHFITSVGSDAGFASIIGLAILVLLYFAQARETATLRDQAEESSLRVQQLEGHLANLGRQATLASAQPATNSVGAAPAGAAPLSPAASAPASAAALAGGGAAATYAGGPVAPAGVGAPALAAATRLIPAGGAVAPAPVAQSIPAQPAPAPIRVPAAPASGNGTGEHDVVAHPIPVTPGAGPATVAAAPAAPATSPASATPPPPVAPGAATAAARTSPPRQPPPPAPPVRRIRPGASEQGALPPIAPAGPSRMRSGGAARGLTALLVIVGLAAVVALLLIVTSNGGSPKPSTSSTAVSNAPAPAPAAKPFNNASVTVAVLNGTSVSGLAGRTATRLTNAGFKKGSVATATDQTRTATVVAYLPGHQNDALQVAKGLKLGPASVQPIDQSTEAVACPPPAACTVNVVVTVGADLKSQ